MNRGRRTLETTLSSLPEGNIRLLDGRRLAYAEYGDPQGKPVFFFHGTPGSRLFHHPDASVAASAGARIIAVDRPGFGRSDFKPGRTLLDWPNDVVQLADALDIQRFAVMGYSGGGPYAAVCASSIPERLTAAGLVSSIAPLDTPQITRGMQGIGHMFFSLDRHLPPLAKLGCWLMCTTWRHNPDLYFRSQINGLRNSEEAQTLLPKMKAMLTADFTRGRSRRHPRYHLGSGAPVPALGLPPSCHKLRCPPVARRERHAGADSHGKTTGECHPTLPCYVLPERGPLGHLQPLAGDADSTGTERGGHTRRASARTDFPHPPGQQFRSRDGGLAGMP